WRPRPHTQTLKALPSRSPSTPLRTSPPLHTSPFSVSAFAGSSSVPPFQPSTFSISAFPLGVLTGAVGDDDTAAGGAVPCGGILGDGAGGGPESRDRCSDRSRRSCC